MPVLLLTLGGFSMKTKHLYLSLIAAFLLIAVVAGSICIHQSQDARASADTFNELENLIVMPTEPVDDVSSTEPNLDPSSESAESLDPELEEAQNAYAKYKVLYEENSDFIGWISIDGTNVNYPVMQTVDTPDFYLKHGFDKAYSNYGVPYLDESCATGLSNNLVIYGHNMKNGSMFHDLLNYSTIGYWEDHQTIRFDTLSQFNEYQVVLAFRFDTNNEYFRYNEYTNMNEDEFIEFMEECRIRQLYDTGVSVEYGDELLTLSTCEYTYDNGRFVVLAKKIAE